MVITLHLHEVPDDIIWCLTNLLLLKSIMSRRRNPNEFVNRRTKQNLAENDSDKMLEEPEAM